MGAAVAALAVLLGAVAHQPAPPAAAGTDRAATGADWAVESPESHGMDPAKLEEARDYAMVPSRNTQAVIVVHQGAIVAEWYGPGADQASYGTSWSVAKSVTSSLIGIAIDEGLIPSIDEPMTTYFPEWIGTPKEAITLRHVLHMESGLDFEEDYDPANAADSDIIQMIATQRDQLAYAAGLPVEVPPGTQFDYSSGDTLLLSGVLEQATGMSAGAYARQKLFDPIGMGAVDWWQDAEGHTLTFCCVDATARDFARFGQLYLDGGQWGGQQVVPASWVTDSLTDTAATNDGYGYQWWLDAGSNGIPARYTAIGFDGQAITVIPSLDLVVVRFGTYVKSPCPPIADPNLVAYLPPLGLVPGKGTVPPSDFSATDFLRPIVDSFTSPGDGDAAEPSGATAPEPATSGATNRAAADECANVASTPTTTIAPALPETAGAAAAVPVAGRPGYTG